MVGLLGRVVAHQVDRHVVRGPERRGQVVGARRGEPGDPLERHLALVDHDRVAERVDPPPSRATRELRVLPRRHELVALPLELPEVLDHDRLRRHVDAERQGLGREHDLDEPGLEQLLDGLLEHGQHPGVVRRDAGRRGLEEQGEPEGVEVGVVDPRRPRLRAIADPRAPPRASSAGRPRPGASARSCRSPPG